MKSKSGILLVNKKSGPTSHDVVDQARKILGTRDVGHTGTLDPIASGLLILTVGLANKLSQYLMDGEKGYKVVIRLGVTTDTLDRSGKILSENPAAVLKITKSQIEEAMDLLQGELTLAVPAFSAVKLDGKKLYEMARNNEKTPRIERKMSFWDLKLLDQTQQTLTISFHCSKGAYVRSWVQALGEKLGCGAIVQELERIYNAPYDLSQATDVENPTWVDFEHILPHWPRIEASAEEAQKIQNGQVSPALIMKAHVALQEASKSPQGAFIVAEGSSQILCFLESQNNELPRLKKVFSKA